MIARKQDSSVNRKKCLLIGMGNIRLISLQYNNLNFQQRGLKWPQAIMQTLSFGESQTLAPITTSFHKKGSSFEWVKSAVSKRILVQQFQYIQSMKDDSPIEKRRYCRTTYETRLQLINMVQKQRETIKSAAKVLKIKESTAKLIVSRYRTSGSIYETVQERAQRKSQKQKEKSIQSIKQQENEDHIKVDSKDQRTSAEKDHDHYRSQDPKLFYPFLQPLYFHPLQAPFFPIYFNQ